MDRKIATVNFRTKFHADYDRTAFFKSVAEITDTEGGRTGRLIDDMDALMRFDRLFLQPR